MPDRDILLTGLPRSIIPAKLNSPASSFIATLTLRKTRREQRFPICHLFLYESHCGWTLRFQSGKTKHAVPTRLKSTQLEFRPSHITLQVTGQSLSPRRWRTWGQWHFVSRWLRPFSGRVRLHMHWR